jgi:ElaB/YqjD/DUF883 family membrane-anchored ribosome-binding protein
MVPVVFRQITSMKERRMASEATSGAAGRGGRAAQTDEGDFARNTQELQDQIETLRNDISAISATLSDLVKAGVREGSATLKRRADEYRRHGQEQADAAMDSAREYSEALEERITQNPFSAVLVALGLGFLIGLMSRR